MKNPWLSALLNGLLPGLGYIYNGVRIEVGLLLFSYSLASLLIAKHDVLSMMTEVMGGQWSVATWQWLLGGLLIVAMAIDSYVEAIKVNSQGRRRRSATSPSNKVVAFSTPSHKTIKK